MIKYFVGIVLAVVSALVLQVLPQHAALRASGAIPSNQHSGDQLLSGSARVIDGDTIEIAGERVRLAGIDAPEIHQTCIASSGDEWRAGRIAANHLERMVRHQHVTCRAAGRDSYGRILGRCTANGRNVNAAMIREGMAWAFRKYSEIYVHDERFARRDGLGIWTAQCRPAWDYRANRWQHAEGNAPGGCAIKGNITSRGRIYHMPWSPWYGRTRIELRRGERWFCNERQALDAGWRPALVR